MFNKELKSEVTELRRQIERLRSDIQGLATSSTGGSAFRQEDRDALRRILSLCENEFSDTEQEIISILQRLREGQTEGVHILKTSLDTLQREERIYRDEARQSNLDTLHEFQYTVNELMRRTEDSIKAAQEAVADYSRRLERYENDFYYKMQSPLLMEFIKLADRLEALSKKPGIRGEDADDIRREFEAVQGVLYNNKVKPYRSEEGTAFDENIQECIGTIVTGAPEKNSTIAESVMSGYAWSLPLVNSLSADAAEKIKVVMREEKVKIFIFKDNQAL